MDINKKLCIIRQAYYPTDPRVRKEVEALLENSYEVNIICLRKKGQCKYEEVNNLKIHRLPLTHKRKGIIRYIFEYLSFFIMAFFKLNMLYFQKRFSIIQIHNYPEILVFVPVIQKLLGAKIVLDMHEVTPEVFKVKFNLDENSKIVIFIRWFDQQCFHYADRVLAVTKQMKDIFVERGAASNKIEVILNVPQTDIFNASRYQNYLSNSKNGKFTLICHGLVEERYGLDTAVKSIALIKDKIPNIRLQIVGDGEYLPDVNALIKKLCVQDYVEVKGYVPQEELLRLLMASDVGIVPLKKYPFWEIVHTNKMFELIALKKPVIITKTISVSSYFDDSCFYYINDSNMNDLADAVYFLYKHPEKATQMVENASRVYEKYKWDIEKEKYLKVINELS